MNFIINRRSHAAPLCSLSLLVVAISSSVAPYAKGGESIGYQLEEVIVTAQKREQSLQEVPLTVSSVTSDTIEAMGIVNLAEITRLVPSLNIHSSLSPAMSSVSIRGAGTGASDPTLEPSVGIFVDGVFMPRSVFGLSDLVDVDRVEVLMGPQGTLYGKNTNAGVVSVYTQTATDTRQGKFEVGAGEDGLFETKLSLGGPLSSTMGYRFSALTRQQDGLIEDERSGSDDYNQLDKQSYRGQIFWAPAESVAIRAIAYYSLSDANSNEPERGFEAASSYYQYAAALSDAVTGTVPGTDAENRKIAITEPGGGRFEVKGGSIQADVEFDNGMTLMSISAYQDWRQSNGYNDSDGTVLDILSTDERMDEQSISQEIRLSSTGDSLSWVTGLFYFKSDLDRGSKNSPYSQVGIGLPAIAAPADALYGAWVPFSDGALTGLPVMVAGDNVIWGSRYQTQSVAVFGQATWDIADAVSLTAGLRYGREEKDFEMNVSAFDASGTAFSHASDVNFGGDGSYQGGYFMPLASGALASGGAIDRRGDRTDRDVSASLSLNYLFDYGMAYVSVANGSKSGGFNGAFGPASSDEREFDSEETTNYEIGLKLEGLLGGRLRANVSYFYTEYKAFQAATFDPVSVAFFVENAGKQITQGVDIDVTYAVSENLVVTARTEYLDAKYSDFEGANCHQLAGGSGCDLSGSRLPFAANWTGSLSADYAVLLANDTEIYSNLVYSFKGDHSVDSTGASFGENVDYELWNARLGWRTEHWDLSVWGKNLTDESYSQITSGNVVGGIFGAVDSGASTLNHNSWQNLPRSLGVSARYSF